MTLTEKDAVWIDGEPVAAEQAVVSVFDRGFLYGDSVFVVRTEGEGDQAVQKVEQVFVTAGRRSQGLVEIVEGVKPGDQVVTAGQNRLSGGARVTVDYSVSPLPSAALD